MNAPLCLFRFSCGSDILTLNRGYIKHYRQNKCDKHCLHFSSVLYIEQEPHTRPVWGGLPKGIPFGGYPSRATRCNVATLCALFFAFVLLVDDAENLVLFLASDTDAFKCLTRSAVGANRTVIHAGKGWSGGVRLPAFRADARLVVAVFHRCTSFALIS